VELEQKGKIETPSPFPPSSGDPAWHVAQPGVRPAVACPPFSPRLRPARRARVRGLLPPLLGRRPMAHPTQHPPVADFPAVGCAGGLSAAATARWARACPPPPFSLVPRFHPLSPTSLDAPFSPPHRPAARNCPYASEPLARAIFVPVVSSPLSPLSPSPSSPCLVAHGQSSTASPCPRRAWPGARSELARRGVAPLAFPLPGAARRGPTRHAVLLARHDVSQRGPALRAASWRGSPCSRRGAVWSPGACAASSPEARLAVGVPMPWHGLR
jgi:hypothetical protein